MSDALLGALIGGGIALIAQIIVAVVNVRAAHNRWLREQRTAAYTALLTSLNLHQQGLEDHYRPNDGLRPDTSDPEWSDLLGLYDDTVKVSLIASRNTGRRAWDACTALVRVTEVKANDEFAALNQANEAKYRLQQAMRRDLGTGRDEMRPPWDK